MDTILESFEECTNPEEYKNPVGWWKVSTEMDIEGRGTAELGIYYGNIATILASLKKYKCYNFFIKKMKVNRFKHIDGGCDYRVINGDNVYISAFYDKKINYEELFKSLFPQEQKFFVQYNPKWSLGSARIYYGRNADGELKKEKDKKIKKALSKLTKEEKELLGISVE